MKVESLNELLQKNNIQMPSDIKQAPATGGKRTQTLIDEYKAKAAKAKEECEKKTAELLAKSKKITELQSAMKRDEALLKKAIGEAARLKKQMQNMKPTKVVQEKLLVQPIAMPGAKGQGSAKGDQPVPDAEEIKNQFMDKLTSQLENFFTVDDETEGAASASTQPSAAKEDDEMLIDTTEKPAVSEGD